MPFSRLARSMTNDDYAGELQWKRLKQRESDALPLIKYPLPFLPWKERSSRCERARVNVNECRPHCVSV